MENENKIGLKVIDMNFSTPSPYTKKDNNSNIVKWGEDNLYPQFLLNEFNNKSITHKQIINRKVKMISGSGIEMPNNPSQAYIDFIENKQGDMSIDKLIIKMAYDLIIFNGISMNPHWNIDNTGLTRICYVPFERIRQDKYNDVSNTNGLPQYFWISDNWILYRKDEYKPFKMVNFDQKWNNDKSQIDYYMGDNQGFNWYPNPEYSAAMNYIDADWEISNYHNSSIKNGFHAGFILNFATGIPTEDEMEKMQDAIQYKFAGSGNANKFILAWSNGSDGSPTLTPIPSNASDTKYLELDKLIRDKILESHEVINPLLFGVPIPGTLGGRNELLESLAMYQSTYIDGKQKIIEDKLNEYASLMGVDITKEPIKLKKYQINIPNIEGTPTLTIADLISLVVSINSGQITNDIALNILTTIYGMDLEKAKKLISAPSPINVQKIIQ